MHHSLLAIAIAIVGISGTLQASRPGSSLTHKVRKGETAAKIARAHGLSMTELKALNPAQNLAKLSTGKLVIVGKDKADKPVSARKNAPLPTLPTLAEEKHALPGPVQALPFIPNPGPMVLIHMERLLPATLQSSIPLFLPAPPAKTSDSAASLVSDIQPILPYAEASEFPSGSAAASFEPADLAHLDLLWPVATRTISSAWGPRMRSRTIKVVKHDVKKRVRVRYRGSHKGVDLTAPIGADVYAAMDGIIVTAGRHPQMGNYVVVDHGNGVTTVYGHHKRNFVHEGDVVRRGQKIAEVGRTGNATGPHLHFELRLNGLHQNPLPYLNDVEEIPAELMAQNQAALPLTRR